MNLAELSTILTREFIRAVIDSKGEVKSRTKFGSYFNKRSVKLVKDIPTYHDVKNKNMNEKWIITNDGFNELIRLVEGDPLRFQIAFCIAWEGRFKEVNSAYMNFLNEIRKAEDTRLNDKAKYNPILFEYIWVCTSSTMGHRNIFSNSPISYFLMENGRDVSKKYLWKILNEAAGFDIDVREFDKYEDDTVFNDYWLIFNKNKVGT